MPWLNILVLGEFLETTKVDFSLLSLTRVTRSNPGRFEPA